MKIIEENGKQYAEMHCRSVAEVMGLAQKDSSDPLRFPVTGYVEDSNGDKLPMLGIEMMSDEKWQQLAEEGAVEHFRKRFGRDPESVQEALKAEREFIADLDRQEEERRKRRVRA